MIEIVFINLLLVGFIMDMDDDMNGSVLLGVGMFRVVLV